MAISPDFPLNPNSILHPDLRWYPGTEIEDTEVGKLIPPLVRKIRLKVHAWRESGYSGVSETSQSLLRHWFENSHQIQTPSGSMEFSYYFAQREAVETAIWLYENQKAHSALDLLRYSSLEGLSPAMFEENWPRYVFKLATGAGKTKVLSLLIAWAFFHKQYEANSSLSTNFLLIAPNIIVLDRLKDDFEGLKIFYNDPVLPGNGWGGRNWQNDFSLRLHIQDEVGPISSTGNLFLTNIHRVYAAPHAPSEMDEDLKDFFLGSKPKGKTIEQKIDLSAVVAGVNDLIVLNDEAHHIHDNSLAWFKAIEDIDLAMRRRTRGHGISIQLDVTATPKKANGAIFPQTVCSYPLVEAIRQGVVKAPVLPDQASRALLQEHPSDKIAEKYADHIKLGVIEWSRYREKLSSSGKKPILFIMTTTTDEANEVGQYLEYNYPEFHQKTLVIHTKPNGEISEKGLKPAELSFLRQASREIDSDNSPYLAVVSVLMLREGWDVQNVVSMVGLRPYSSDSKILPEQTLGRGLRRMFRGDNSIREHVSIIGTPAFLEFVEQIQSEGVDLDHIPMGQGSDYRGPMVLEIERENKDKNKAKLDIEIPVLSRRLSRDHKNMQDLDLVNLDFKKVPLVEFTAQEQRQIVFRDIDTDAAVWKTDLNSDVVPSSQSVIAFLADHIARRMRLVGGRDILYGKLKEFISIHLFDRTVSVDDPNVLRNLSEVEARKTLLETFTKAINRLTISDAGATRVINSIKLSEAKPSVVKNQEFVLSSKTLFNRIIGDSGLELRFASFLDKASDVEAFAKNIMSINFRIEYVNGRGEIASYYPDFMVKVNKGLLYIVETKGIEDTDTGRKWDRLVSWCQDATSTDLNERKFVPLYVTQQDFEDYAQKSGDFLRFAELLKDAKPEMSHGLSA
jgi:type III restriction enzyme